MATSDNVFMAAQALLNEQYTESYQAFAGVDLMAYIGPIPLGTLQAISYSVARETGSLYTCGDPSPKAFVRGKRAISGSLIFTQFDRDIVLRIMEQVNQKSSSSNSTVYTIGDMLGLNNGANVNEYVLANQLPAVPGATGISYAASFGRNVATLANLRSREVLGRPVRYADQLPPFNVAITLANERGGAAVKSLLNVVLVNEGGGYTIDDLQSQVAYTFLAKTITPLTPAESNFAWQPTTVGGVTNF